MANESGESFWLGLAFGVGVMWAWHTWGGLWRDPNEKPIYGDTGLPKNCKAIIQANLDGWHTGAYTAPEVLGSIERNCGPSGYSWKLD